MFSGRYIVVLCSVCLSVISSAAHTADCLSGFSALFSLSSVMYACVIGCCGAMALLFKLSARRFALRHLSSERRFCTIIFVSSFYRVRLRSSLTQKVIPACDFPPLPFLSVAEFLSV